MADNAPASPLVTFGSDLTGDPVAIPGTFPEDTEFWTQGVTVPADGTITRFRLRIGSDPVDLPLRFSITRPQADGSRLVVSTTDPPYPLPGNRPGTYTFDASDLSFRCCRVRGRSMDPGNRWTGTPHQDLELLLQLEMRPD